MATPLKPAGENRDPRPRGRRGAGAVAAGGKEDPNRKRRLAAWLLLAALIIAAAVVGIVLAATSSHHTASSSAQATADSTSSAQATAGSTTSAQATAGSISSAPAAALPPFGLVGGGGVTPQAATGKLAVTGSVGDVLFAEDGTALDSSAMKVITTAAQDIRQHQVTMVTVIGYTDAIGNAATNTQLSLERARAVIAALRPLSGTTVSYRAEARGQGQPVAANSTAAGRQLNRRVVITTG
jgi:outer membrane protein OmpA-like peptidoglycan-associated protein